MLANGVDFPNPEAERFRHDTTRLWHNEGRGRFAEAAAAVGMDDDGDGRGVVIFDYDDDGDQDVLIAQHEGRALLYRNEGGSARGYLRVRLIGREGNRDALGARVRVRRRAGEPWLLRESIGGSQFLGQSESILHFGLGAYGGPVAELEVRWPDGETTRLRDVESRRMVEIRE